MWSELKMAVEIPKIERVPTTPLLEEETRDPFSLLQRWLSDGFAKDEPMPMSLSTSTLAGKPSSRIVLLVSATEGGLLFCTDCQSNKGKDLDENPRVAALFYWPQYGRQLRVEGDVEMIRDDAVNEKVFHQLPRLRQILYIALRLGMPIDREKMIESKAMAEEQLKDCDVIPCPSYFKGYRLLPNRIVFYQTHFNDPDLNDVITCRKSGGEWTSQRVVS